MGGHGEFDSEWRRSRRWKERSGREGSNGQDLTITPSSPTLLPSPPPDRQVEVTEGKSALVLQHSHWQFIAGWNTDEHQYVDLMTLTFDLYP